MLRWIEEDKKQDRTAVLMRFTAQRQDKFRALGDQNKNWEVLSGNKNMALFLTTTSTYLYDNFSCRNPAGHLVHC